MIKSLAAIAALAAIALPAPSTADSAPFPSCGDEADADLFPCVWDARHDGDGNGHSYLLNRNGDIIRIPHTYAHALRH